MDESILDSRFSSSCPLKSAPVIAVFTFKTCLFFQLSGKQTKTKEIVLILLSPPYSTCSHYNPAGADSVESDHFVVSSTINLSRQRIYSALLPSSLASTPAVALSHHNLHLTQVISIKFSVLASI